jgi:dihydrofolate synthase/folylpolyglutamate synthase
LIFQDECGLLDLPLPNLPGAHQIQNAGIALAALRHLEAKESACEAAITQAHWPARLQRLREGPLPALAPGAELWLDGGHNPAAGQALAQFLANLPKRPTYLICGMLNTKDITGYLAPLHAVSETLFSVSIPNEVNTLSADDTARNAAAVGFYAQSAQTVDTALRAISAQEPHARIVICGSLYLAGMILRQNG